MSTFRDTLFDLDWKATFSSPEALREVLEEKDEKTVIRPVSKESCLLLSKNGVTGDGLRLSKTAFFQICSALSPGLFSTVVSIAGIQYDDKLPKNAYDIDDAILIYNTALNRRFRYVLRGERKILVELPNKAIGLVSDRYSSLPNLSLFDQLDGVLSSIDEDLQFSRAFMEGRKLEITYLSREPLCKLGDDDNLYAGVYFINSEVAGDVGIRGGVLLYREKLDSFYRKEVIPHRRIQHVGKRIQRRMKNLVSRISQTYESLGWKVGCPPAAQQIWLGFDGGTEQRDIRSGELISLLQQQGIPTKLAKDSVSYAIMRGAYDTSSEVSHIGRLTLSNRSVFDLAQAISVVAKSCIRSKRHILESVAFTFLTRGQSFFGRQS